jgi:hypothetical protein
MDWKNPDGSVTRGVVIEDGAGDKITSFGGGGAGGSNASVGVTGAASPTSATEIGFTNALGTLSGVSASSPLPVVTTDSGAAITGASMPAGGSGLTGWLSAIWSKLSGTLSVIGSVSVANFPSSQTVTWSGQSVSLSGTLPAFAAAPTVTLGSAIPTGANVIGAVNLDIGGASVSQGNPVPTTETYSNINTGQISVATSATQIVAARAGRKEVTIANHATTAVYIGGPSVTAATGLLLAGVQGQGITITGAAAIYAVAASGTETVSFLEVY